MTSDDFFDDERIEKLENKPKDDRTDVDIVILADYNFENLDRPVHKWRKSKGDSIIYKDVRESIGLANTKWRLGREYHEEGDDIDRLKSKLREAEHELGRPPTTSEISEYGDQNIDSRLVDEHGSWENVLKESNMVGLLRYSNKPVEPFQENYLFDGYINGSGRGRLKRELAGETAGKSLVDTVLDEYQRWMAEDED